jgi:hypothetical protein
MSEKRANAMQAVLDRAARQASLLPEPTRTPTLRTQPEARQLPRVAFDRLSRRNTKLIGGHFSPELARQLRILAAEEDTTIQGLLEEAIQLLLAKKARGKLGSAG